MSEMDAAGYEGLDGLVAVTARLRAPGGCPWDAEQTHESLVQYLLEETHELIEAIESGNRDDLIEELGDVLFQVLFHAEIATHSAEENFTIDDVAEHMTAKMIGRHPHVFGETEVKSSEELIANWDDLKQVEKPHRTSVLDGVPQGMPALALGQKLLGKAEKVGVGREPARASAPQSEAELGEQLMALTALARAKGWDAERAMREQIRQLQADVRAAEA